MVNLKDLDTGDVILFDTRFWYSRLIERFTQSSYSHVGIILRNPFWLDPKLKEDLYLLESGREMYRDAETGEYRFGVQITSFRRIYHDYQTKGYGKLYVRKLNLKIEPSVFKMRLTKAYFEVNRKPYDLNLLDWLAGYYELNKSLDNPQLTENYQKTKSFWCSALAGFIFVQCGLLGAEIPWTLISPRDFSDQGTRLQFKNCALASEQRLV